jgi:hypothetical protein
VPRHLATDIACNSGNGEHFPSSWCKKMQA